jgi:Na+-driven multidrug efflux pump
VLGVLYGFGQTRLTMVLNISRVFVFRIPVLWYLQTFHKEMGAEAAGISMGISNICIAIASLSCLAFFLYKLKKKEKIRNL